MSTTIYRLLKLIISCILITYILFIIQSYHCKSFKQDSFLNKKRLIRSSTHLIRSAIEIPNERIQRAILIFYPDNQEKKIFPEIRWLYRSWIEMMKYESKNWRTDLIIYTGQYTSALKQLNCILNQIRTTNIEQPQCRIFPYLRLSKRDINSLTKRQILLTNESKNNLFQIDIQRSKLLYEQIKSYEYIDSVNVIAEAYPTYEYYDFILKTDIDVFITKEFAKYVPITNITLLVGRGGYSTVFNTRRLGRIARDIGWKYQNMTNIGSTWYVNICNYRSLTRKTYSRTLILLKYIRDIDSIRVKLLSKNIENKNINIYEDVMAFSHDNS